MYGTLKGTTNGVKKVLVTKKYRERILSGCDSHEWNSNLESCALKMRETCKMLTKLKSYEPTESATENYGKKHAHM